MKMSASTFIFLCVIIFGVAVTHSAGQVKGSERCICSGKPIKNVHFKRVLSIETFPASSFCSKIEILVTVKKTGKKLCLDPSGKQGKMFLSRKTTLNVGFRRREKKRKRGHKKRRN